MAANADLIPTLQRVEHMLRAQKKPTLGPAFSFQWDEPYF